MSGSEDRLIEAAYISLCSDGSVSKGNMLKADFSVLLPNPVLLVSLPNPVLLVLLPNRVLLCCAAILFDSPTVSSPTRLQQPGVAA